MNSDSILVKTTLKNILKETVGVSGAIVRVEVERHYWTYIYFESTLAEAPTISEKIIGSLRLRHRFQEAGNHESVTQLTTFHEYPSPEKRVQGVAILESVVSKAGIRPGSSGARYQFTPDTTLGERSVRSVLQYVGRACCFVTHATALHDKIRGIDAGPPKDDYRHERTVWVKYDGDRLSRKITTTVDAHFEQFLCESLLAVDATGRIVEYCLACSQSRLLETMSDVFRASEGDREITILAKRDAFVSRK
jgi:hypothetical protein